MSSKFAVMGLTFGELKEKLKDTPGIDNAFILFRLPENESGESYEKAKGRCVTVTNYELKSIPNTNKNAVLFVSMPFKDL
jgi:hypothetical protein